MTPASPELVAIVEAGLVCPKCQAINIPGAKPTSSWPPSSAVAMCVPMLDQSPSFNRRSTE